MQLVNAVQHSAGALPADRTMLSVYLLSLHQLSLRLLPTQQPQAMVWPLKCHRGCVPEDPWLGLGVGGTLAP